MGRLKSWLFNVYVACNMLLCAVLMLGTSRPRETISGWIGRTLEPKSWLVRIVDAIYFWEPDHCHVTAEQEAEARKALHYGAE